MTINNLRSIFIISIFSAQAYASTSAIVDLDLDGEEDKCLIETNKDYPRIKCFIKEQLVFDEYYPDLTSEFNIEAGIGGILVKLKGKLSESNLYLQYNSGLWTTSKIEFTYHHKDIDNKQTYCQKNLTITYQDYLKYQDNNALTDQSKGCVDKFEITRTLTEIHKHLNPQIDNGDYPNGAEFFVDRKRYVEYLKKYPLSRENEKIYTEMAGWLQEYKLYNEAILLASNVLQFNPKSLNASLCLAEAYYYLKEDKLAKKYYVESIKLSKELKIALPEKITNHFNKLLK